MATDDEIRAAVTHATNKRRAMLSALEFETVVQFVRGRLRSALGTMPLDLVALKFVDLLLDGRRNTPPNPYRPQLRRLVASVYETNKLPPPPVDVADVIVSVAAGVVIDLSLPVIPAARTFLIREIVGLYLLGM